MTKPKGWRRVGNRKARNGSAGEAASTVLRKFRGWCGGLWVGYGADCACKAEADGEVKGLPAKTSKLTKKWVGGRLTVGWSSGYLT